MENETKIYTNIYTGEKVYATKLNNGLKVFVCPKKDYVQQIGMLGTIYGSIDNDFIDVTTGERKKVPDGIAHFLEHKLFEQEDGNALDLFSKMGVSSNAYTSLDHTVYYFETSKNFNECLKTLFSFVNTPYFTDKNVEKEKGIISQELKMYDDDPDAVAYYKTLAGIYKNLPLKVDIGGTQESINKITKEMLYSCYRTFYNPSNMFCVIIADIDPEVAINQVNKEYVLATQAQVRSNIPVRFFEAESKEIAYKEQEKQLDMFLPIITFGFKQEILGGEQSIKSGLIIEIINYACFSTFSDFYEKMYQKQILNQPAEIAYESGKNYAHILCMGASLEYNKFEQEMLKYISQIKEHGITQDMLNIVKNKLIGDIVYEIEEPMAVHRNIINSIIQKTDIYKDERVLSEITLDEVNNYVKEAFDFEKMTITRVLPKEQN